MDARFIFLLVLLELVAFQGSSSQVNDTTAISSKLTSCNKGWFSYGDMCYGTGGKNAEKLDWERADKRCKEYGGLLATIHSQELSDFLRTFILLDITSNVWIGIHDRVNESVYHWLDGTKVDYTNWVPSEPTGAKDEEEDCVEVMFRPLKPGGESGNWNDIDCNKEQKFICQKKKSKKQGRMSSDPRFCPPRIGGWRLRTSCYQIVPEKLSWTEAEEYCITIHQGHLVAIKDFTVQLFLEYILKNYTEDMWIGIKIKDELQQQWSSGWFVSYTKWMEEDFDFTEGTCAALTVLQDWETFPCNKPLPFICESSAAIPPTLASSNDLHCPDEPEGWRDLGGDYCYFFDTNSPVSWSNALFMCMRRGGTLTSLHSKEEAEALQQFLIYTPYNFWIGLYRSLLNDDTFAWVDGTPLNFANWAPGEPNSNREQCAEMRPETLLWNDIGCDSRRGYICSIRKISTYANKTDINSKVVSPSCPNGISIQSLVGVTLCVLFVAVLLGMVIYFFCQSDRAGCGKSSRKSSRVSLPPSSRDQKARYRTVSEIVIGDDTYENLNRI